MVIAVIALLMSILMPALQRARKQAKAVVCQANLRQWGTLYAAYAAEHDGYLIPWTRKALPKVTDPWWAAWRWSTGGPLEDTSQDLNSSSSWTVIKRIAYCRNRPAEYMEWQAEQWFLR